MAKPKPVKEPKNFDDPPEESEDESESNHSLKYLDSSEDETLRGNIQRTNFKGGKSSTTANTASAYERSVKGKDPVKGTGRAPQATTLRQNRGSKRTKTEDIDEDGDDISSGSKKAKTASDKLAGEVGDHMKKEILSVFGNRAKNRPGYGKKADKFDKRKQRDLSDSTSPVKQFKYHNSHGSLQSSPVSLKLSQKMKNDDGSSSDLSDPPSSDKSDPPRALGDREKKAKGRKGKKTNVLDFSESPMSKMPVFKIPEAYADYAPVELGDFDTAMDDMPVVQKRQLDPGMVLCPMCDEQVDEELLKEFSKGARMVMAQQSKFCRMHKKKSAEELYVEKGYPEIDWTTLVARIERHHDFLKSLIMGAESHFAGILTENIRTGNARTLLTTQEYPTPGYYGLRGMALMTEMVTETFSRLLRKRAPTDTRISGRGYTGFVQSVLVPELAVKLIQEDLSLDGDKAREVMVESRELGEILNDEKRQSQPRPHIESRQTSPEEEGQQEHQESEDEEEEEEHNKSDDEAPADLKPQDVANSDSALSSPPSRSQSLPSITGEPSRKGSDNGSDGDIPPRSGQASKIAKAPVKTQDATALPVRASPRNSKITKKSTLPTVVPIDDSLSDDSDDSGASSGLESI